MSKIKTNKLNYSFVALPKYIFQSYEYAALIRSAKVLLIDVFIQYNGKNNGDLAITWSMMQRRGWKSKATLERAKKALLKTGFIEETRKGGRHCCSLFAVTWLNIDCDRNKLDCLTSSNISGWRQLSLPV